MEVYDQNGNLIENPDLTIGRLEERTRTVHHDAVEGVTEVWHYETVAEYPNGGKDVRKIIDVPGVTAQAAYDEEVPYQVYIPYTAEELADMQEAQNQPSETELMRQRIEALEEQNAMLMDCILEMSELVYS